jgi:hypothetical protein
MKEVKFRISFHHQYAAGYRSKFFLLHRHYHHLESLLLADWRKEKAETAIGGASFSSCKV